jgi:uncharacterized protein (TIGR03437 family)
VYLDTRPLLASTLVSQNGELSNLQVARDFAAINQPIENAGTEVGVTFDSAFGPEAFRNPLDIRILKGHLGGSRLRIHNVTPSGLELLGEWEHDGVIDDNPDNIRFFHLDFSAVAQGLPYEAPAPVSGTMLWAFYVASYSLADWADNPALRDAPLAPYGSDDASAIARHLDEAASAGIGGFIVSWDGPGSLSDGNLPLILQTAAARDFAIAVELETLDEQGQPQEQVRLEQSIAQLLQTHGIHPAYHRVDGRPVVFVNDADMFSLETWTGILAAIRGQALDGFFLGDGLANEGLDVFDAIYHSVATNDSEWNLQLIRARPAVRYYHLLSDDPRINLATATVQPGYDDSLLKRDPPAFIDRQDGEIYETSFQRAIYTPASWILISSWNQFYENTHIEPSQNYGDSYLQITTTKHAAWDDPRPLIHPGGIVNAASYLHNAVAPGEIISLFGIGIGPPESCAMELIEGGTRAATEVCETEVQFNGTPAPIVYTQSDQTSVVAPLWIQDLIRIRVNVHYRGIPSGTHALAVTRAVPGILTLDASGAGPAAALLLDYSVIGAGNPATRGSTILVFMTSGGVTEPPGEDGQIVSGIEVLQLPVRAEIGGIPATVSFAGSAPSLIKGVLQLNVRVPENASIGDAVSLDVWIGGMRAQEGVTIAVQ